MLSNMAPTCIQAQQQLSSPWAMLNHAKPHQLSQAFKAFQALPLVEQRSIELQQAQELLAAYQAIYCSQWMQRRTQGYRSQCPPPTAAQLAQISKYLEQQTQRTAPPPQILAELQLIGQALAVFAQRCRA